MERQRQLPVCVPYKLGRTLEGSCTAAVAMPRVPCCSGVQFALRASRGDDLPIHGDGGSHRSFLFVEDVAEAFDIVLHKVGTAAAVSHLGSSRWAQ